MTTNEAIEFIHSVNNFFCKPGLERIEKLCEALGARFEYGELFDGSERFAVKLQLPIAEDKERVEK